MTSPKFHLVASHWFLTYSQCPVSKEDMLDHIQDLPIELKNYIVAHELHKDGNDHLHVYIWNKRKNIYSPAFFDYTDDEGNVYHPNIEIVRNDLKVQKYCKKGCDFLTDIKKDIYARLIDLAKDNQVPKAMDLLATEKPQEVVKFGNMILANLTTLSTAQVHVEEKYEFYKPPGIEHWKRDKWVLWLRGATETGKTSYAKTLFKNPLLVRNKNQLKSFKAGVHDGIIFDDMYFMHWPMSSCIHLTDIADDSGIDVKHSHVVIPAGTPRVFTSNGWIWPDDPHKAIQRRVFYCKVNFDLRKSPLVVTDSVPKDFLMEDKSEQEDYPIFQAMRDPRPFTRTKPCPYCSNHHVGECHFEF